MAETALITGASAGLGLEYARLLAAERNDLVLVARRKDRLDALASELSKAHGVRVHVISADLATSSGQRQVLDEVQRLRLQIDVLVNNAGFGTSGPFWKLDPERERDLIELNVTALVALTRAFLPGMVKRRRGRLLNIGSTAGFQPGPYMASYYASKAFVNSFTEALAYELRGSGVTATLSCPGPTATEFPAVAGTDKTRLFRLGAMSARDVAAQGHRAMRAGRTRTVHGLKNKVAGWSVRFSPRRLVTWIAASLNRPPRGQTVPELKA